MTTEPTKPRNAGEWLDEREAPMKMCRYSGVIGMEHAARMIAALRVAIEALEHYSAFGALARIDALLLGDGEAE